MNSKRKKFKKRDFQYLIMCLPVLVMVLLFSVLNKFGIILAFKDFNYVDGIWGSPWNGLKNFQYIFSSGDMVRAISNTLFYKIVGTLGITLLELIIAILLYMVGTKLANRMQQIVMVPYFVSMSCVAAIVYIFLRYDGGIINNIFELMGKEPVAWYNNATIWPFLLIGIQFWWGAGIGSIYYYSGFMGIDSSLYEAVDIDGGNWWHKIRHIMLPGIVQLMCLFLIKNVASILASDLGMFYSIPRGSSALISVTDTIATYEYRGLQLGNISTTAALGVFVSLTGFILMHTTNAIVKKINSDNAMY